jgi:hypothetical protein
MEDRQRCLPVTYDEGLHSYKAIAFIRDLIFYLELGAISQPNVLSKQKPLGKSLEIQVKIYG